MSQQDVWKASPEHSNVIYFPNCQLTVSVGVCGDDEQVHFACLCAGLLQVAVSMQ